jgi:hypothetical protein
MAENIKPAYAKVKSIKKIEYKDYEKTEFDHVRIRNNPVAFECDVVMIVRGTQNVTDMHAWLRETKQNRLGRFTMYIEPARQECLVQICDTVSITSDEDNLINMNFSNYIEVSLRVQVME